MTGGYGLVPRWQKAIASLTEVPCPVCGNPVTTEEKARRQHIKECEALKAKPVPPEFTIDPELQALIPPLSPDEYLALESSLKSEGCRDALVVWTEGSVLLDGHNRYEICRVNKLPYPTVKRSFETREEAMLWIIQNQLSRRNVFSFVRAELMVKAKPIANKLHELARVNMSEGGKGFVNSRNPIHTDEELSKLAGVSSQTIYRVRFVTENAPSEIITKARTGEISTHRAYLLTKALDGKPLEVQEVALKYAGDEPDKVTMLNSLHKTRDTEGSNGTFDEIAATGGFHYGDDMDDWCDFAESGVLAVKNALKSLAKHHAQIAAELRQIERDAMQPDKEALTTPRYLIGQAEAMPLPDNRVDLIITSPPYNMGGGVWKMGYECNTPRPDGIGYDDDMPEVDYQAWQVDCLVEMYRVARPGASLFYNHKERLRNGASILPTDWLRHERNPWTLRQTIVWNRTATHNHNEAYFYPEVEYIYWLTKGAPELPERSIGMSCLWTFFGMKSYTWHPAPFVEELPDMLIRAIGRTPPLTVLDPFAGSGTTLLVASRYGYEAIGFDINPDYAAKANEVNQWNV